MMREHWYNIFIFSIQITYFIIFGEVEWSTISRVSTEYLLTWNTPGHPNNLKILHKSVSRSVTSSQNRNNKRPLQLQLRSAQSEVVGNLRGSFKKNFPLNKFSAFLHFKRRQIKFGKFHKLNKLKSPLMASHIRQIKFILRIKPSVLLSRQPKRLSLITALKKVHFDW